MDEEISLILKFDELTRNSSILQEGSDSQFLRYSFNFIIVHGFHTFIPYVIVNYI